MFSSLLDIVEANRATIRAACHDSRFVWLPLQYALLPEEHDSQSELDTLVERAVGEKFVEGNFVSYVINEQFQLQLARTIREANDYHVLWIHDVRGINADGDPDEMAFRHVTRAYLSTLTERVRAYDRTGTDLDLHHPDRRMVLPSEQGSHLVELLEDPSAITRSSRGGTRRRRTRSADAQESLRRAVAESKLLQAKRADHGDDWLRSVIKVQVNVTNAADQTFWSRDVIKGLAYPTTSIAIIARSCSTTSRRRIPTRGKAMYTGAGVGEH